MPFNTYETRIMQTLVWGRIDTLREYINTEDYTAKHGERLSEAVRQADQRYLSELLTIANKLDQA